LSVAQIEILKGYLDFLLCCNKDTYDGIEIVKSTNVLSVIGLLCHFMLHQKDNNSITNSNDDFLSIVKILEYIHNNYNEKITIMFLCQLSHMSRSTLIRCFKKICNCTPIEYLTNYRVKKAHGLLLQGNLSKAIIAQECGFYDVSHLTKHILRNDGDLFFSLRNSGYK
jgi:AraC-like DNA-binding protein